MNPKDKFENFENRAKSKGLGEGRYNQEEIFWFIKRLHKLTEALEFYADDRNYTNDGIIFDQYYVGPTHEPVIEQTQDYGNKARKVLEEGE